MWKELTENYENIGILLGAKDLNHYIADLKYCSICDELYDESCRKCKGTTFRNLFHNIIALDYAGHVMWNIISIITHRN